MDMQTKRGKEQMKALPFKEKLRNFFFYYKWHVIICVFAVAVILFSLAECSKRVEDDLVISYFSESYIDESTVSKMHDFFSYEYCIDDINADGERNLLISSYSGIDENVTTKYMAEIAAGESMAFLFDQTYYDLTMQNQPESVDFACDITKNVELKQLFGLGDEPLYFAVKSVYDAEQGDEMREKMHDNAVSLYNIIAGDDMTVVYYGTKDIDEALITAFKDTFGEYIENINEAEQKIVGISAVCDPDVEALAEQAGETIKSGAASAFLIDGAFYKTFESKYPYVIEDSEDISSVFDLPDGSLYYVLSVTPSGAGVPENAEPLHGNALRVLSGLRNKKR